MKAAVCDSPGSELVIKSIPIPEPQAGQLLVKMESCGVCHSDLHLRDGDESLPADCYPLVLGHEGIGRIVQHGAGVSGAPAIGVRVGLPWLYSTCEKCQPCLCDEETLCESQVVRGIDTPGGFAEYALVDAQFAVEIPDGIDSVKGAPLLCAGLTAWSALKKTKLSHHSNVLIIGAGGLGQYAIGVAKSKGATVFVVDRSNERLQQAQALGADKTFINNQDTAKEIMAAGGADIVVNFAPDTTVWTLIENAVNKKSDIVCVALIYKTVDLSMMWLIDGGHRVFGSSVGSRSELKDYLSFASDHQQWVDVETVALTDVNSALNRLKSGSFKGRLCVDFGHTQNANLPV